MVIKQGDLLWVTLPPPRGSEPAGRRPALVIQCNAFNSSRINTILIAPVTSNLRYESLPGNVRLLKGESGINKPSVVNISQIHSIEDRAPEQGKTKSRQTRPQTHLRYLGPMPGGV
jgi:mRNA interferase MazF